MLERTVPEARWLVGSAEFLESADLGRFRKVKDRANRVASVRVPVLGRHFQSPTTTANTII